MFRLGFHVCRDDTPLMNDRLHAFIQLNGMGSCNRRNANIFSGSVKSNFISIIQVYNKNILTWNPGFNLPTNFIIGPRFRWPMFRLGFHVCRADTPPNERSIYTRSSSKTAWAVAKEECCEYFDMEPGDLTYFIVDPRFRWPCFAWTSTTVVPTPPP
jgi:hypothetical protein